MKFQTEDLVEIEVHITDAQITAWRNKISGIIGDVYEFCRCPISAALWEQGIDASTLSTGAIIFLGKNLALVEQSDLVRDVVYQIDDKHTLVSRVPRTVLLQIPRELLPNS